MPPIDDLPKPNISDLPKPNISDLPKPNISDLPKPTAPTLKERLMEMLPAAGSIAGGIGGAISPIPGGTWIGSGAGGAAGESLKEYLQNKPQNPTDIGTQGLLGLLGEGVAQTASGAARLAAPYIKPLIEPLVKPVQDLAGRLAAKSLGMYQRDVLRNSTKLENLGGKLLDEGVIGNVPVSYKTLGKRAGEKADIYGEQIGKRIEDITNLQKEAGSQVPQISKQEIASDIIKDLPNPEGLSNVARDNRKIRNMAESFQGSGPAFSELNAQQAQDLRMLLNKKIPWQKVRTKEPLNAEEQFNVDTYFNLGGAQEALDKKLEGSLVDKLQGKSLPELRSSYGPLAEAKNIAETRSNKEFANKFLSPSDLGVGFATAGLDQLAEGSNPKHGAALGLAGALLSKGARRYGNQIMAKQLSNLLAAPTADTTYRLMVQPQMSNENPWTLMGGSQ